MMKFSSLVLILLFMAFSARGQEPPKVEVFGGYSFMRGDLGGISANLHGLNGSVTYNLDSILGIKADFSGHTGSRTITAQAPILIPILGPPSTTTTFDLSPRDFTFLFGPQVTYRKKQTIIPFAHILLGGVNRKVRVPISATQTATTTTVTFVTGSDTGFGAAFGGGLDLRVSKRVALRAFQVDYLLSRVTSGTQHNLRLGTGLVLRFGK